MLDERQKISSILYQLAHLKNESSLIDRKVELTNKIQAQEVKGWVTVLKQYDEDLAKQVEQRCLVTDSMLSARFNYLTYLRQKDSIPESQLSLWLRFTFASIVAKYDEYLNLEADDFVARYHADLDRASRQHFQNFPEDQKELACQRGCATCCHQYIPAVLPEVAAIARKYPEKIHNLKRDKLYEMAKYHIYEQFKKSSRDIQRCPFLDDTNACSIYEDRPGMCRSYYAKFTNKFCDPFRPELEEKAKTLVPEEASYCLSAALSLYGEFSLAELALLRT
jgi:Fe-S-cluster containining protein